MARRSTRCWRGCSRCSSTRASIPIVTNKTPRRRQGHPHRQRQQPLRRRHDEGPGGLHGAVPAQLAPGEAETASSSRRCTASAAGTTRRSREIVGHLEAAIPFATEPMAEGAARAGQVLPDRRDRPTARRTTSPGSRTRTSPVDTINGFIEVYMDARGVKGSWEALVFYVNPEKTEAIRKLAGRRAVVRGPHAVGRASTGSRTSAGSRPTPSRSSSRRATPGRSRRSASTCPTTRTIREQHGSKSVSLSNVIEAYDKSTPPEFRSEFSWTPEEAARATKWSALAGELLVNMHEVIGHASGKVAERLERQAAGRAQGAVSRRSRRRGPISSRSTSCPTRSSPSSAWCRRRTRTRSSAPSTRATRATPSSSSAASAKGRRSKKTTCATAR